MRKFKPGNIAAMLRAQNLGRTLQDEHPEMAEMYRKGLSYREIAENLGLAKKYGIKLRSAISIVHFGIVGTRGLLGEGGYDGLIKDQKEIERLGNEHQDMGGELGKTRGPIALGYLPWSDEEKGAAYRLYRHSDLTYSEIAQEMNTSFHGSKSVRTKQAFKRMLERNRKSLEQKLSAEMNKI